MTQRQNDPVPVSPSHPSFSDKLSAIGARISRTLTGEISVSEDGTEKGSIQNTATTGSPKDRSQSRGREFHSTGRGGVGNIRPSSTSRDARTGEGLSPTRGRERLPPPADIGRNYTTGRGGTGNIRSPSRDGRSPLRSDLQEELEAEDLVIQAHSVAEQDMPHSTGRGGIGNITRSRSRGPADLSSAGRGGSGNIVAGEGLLTEVLDNKPSRSRSTGRGGAGNITVEHAHTPPPPHVHAMGRGGAGNIVPDVPEAQDSRHSITTEHDPHVPHVHSTGRGGSGNIRPDKPEVVEDEEERLKLHHPGGVHTMGRGGAGNITHD